MSPAFRKRLAYRRVTCGAKTRQGQPCRSKSEPGRDRCRFHGGLSTGPKTEAGRAKISATQKARWAAYHRQQRGLKGG
nr:HGGxSTG domain-containing protein [Ruegeria sp. WL0004]